MTRPYEALTIEQVATYPRPGTVVPAGLTFTPDSTALTYLYSGEGNLVRSLWRYEIATGERTVIAGPPPQRAYSRDEELRRERMRLREEGVTSFAFAPRASTETLLVPRGGAVSAAIGGEDLRQLPGTDGAIDPRLSPDGQRVAFVKDGDLYVANTATGALRQLTHDARPGVTNGLAEFMAQEELDRSRGFWWSPDGNRIAYIQADERHIPPYPIVHQGLDHVEVETHRYPFAGAPNARLKLGVYDLETGATTWLNLGPDQDIYIARVDWRPDGVLTAQVLSRAQQDLALVAFDAAEPRILLHERSQPWLNLSDCYRFLDSGELLWSSERTGFRHLYLFDADGSPIRDLTAGEWVVTSLVGVDQPRRLVYFHGTKDGVTERHVYRVSLDGGLVERLTEGRGLHGGTLSPDGRWLAVESSSPEQAPKVTLRDTVTGERRTLFENEGNTAWELGLRPPELHRFTGPSGDELDAAVYAPYHPEPGRRYPVIVSVYGGPHVQRVSAGWGSTVDMRAQYLAQQGCYVVQVDNRGSTNRGLAFEAPIHLETGRVEVEDQVAAVRWLGETFPDADTSRVGVYGWSYGGYMTLMCLCRSPEVFKVGVSGAPVTHWDGYDTAYTERYMSTPQLNPGGYEHSSVMANLEGLRGKLLIVHGMIDENVHFRHTARLLKELARLGKPYETLLYPEERHMPRDAKGLTDQERKVLGFLMANV